MTRPAGRVPFAAAQGVKGWYRWIGGRRYMFTLVTAGWWGVGETGTLRAYRQHASGDWFCFREVAPHA